MLNRRDFFKGVIAAGITVTYGPAAGAIENVNDIKLDKDSGLTVFSSSSYPKYIEHLISNFKAGELILISGRPCSGKTTIALEISSYFLFNTNKSAALFSLEKPVEDAILEMLCRDANINIHRFEKYGAGGKDLAKFARAAGKLEHRALCVDDSSSITLKGIREKAKKVKTESKSNELGLIMIDYIQLIKDINYSNAARTLKEMAVELNTPVIAVNQLRRYPELRDNKKPVPADIGMLERYADVVVLLYRNESVEGSNIEVNVALNCASSIKRFLVYKS